MSLQSMLLGTDKMPASERIERLESQVDYLKARVTALETALDERTEREMGITRPKMIAPSPAPADPRPARLSARDAMALECGVDADTIRRKVNHDPAFAPLADTLRGVKISESDQAMAWLAAPEPLSTTHESRYYAITHGYYTCLDAMAWHMQAKRRS